ncbi:MAG: hypothetical protein E7452_00035 [Ruminococcaceae bacterium]|nr:hypothetical protein [Oscillospiraceae bacterium]
MDKFKKIAFRLLYPPVWLIWVLSFLSIGLLVYVFLISGNSQSIVAYASYVVEAYTLTAICMKTPILFRWIKRVKRDNKYISRYFSDRHLRVKLSLYGSVTINALYALLQLYSGVFYHSVWFYSLASYYFVLALMRFFVLRDTIRTDSPGLHKQMEWRRYRFCGVLLLWMHVILSAIVFYIVRQNRGFAYNEIITITMAAYTFTTLTVAIIGIVRYRRYESPLLSAAKALSFTAALVSLLSLETAMLTAFRTEENTPLFRQIMTGATGGVVCVMVLAMAVYMIVRATKAIRSIQQKEDPQ